jgi:hypothetical protein
MEVVCGCPVDNRVVGRFWKFLTSIALTACMAAGAQTSGSRALQLKLEPGTEFHGVPVSFVYTILNASSHDIRMPKPVVNCGDVYLGEVWVHVKFIPAGHTIPSGLKNGCVNDYLPVKSVLQRVESWQVLHPGESISQTLPQEQLHYDASKAGSYEVWAEYRRPYLSPQDEQMLRKAGIAFPAVDIQTPHQTYRSKPENAVHR